MGKTVGDVPSFSYFIILSIVQDHGRHLVFRTLIPGSGIPEWFNHQKEEDIEFMEKKESLLKIKPTSPHACACFSPYLEFCFPFLTFLN